MSDLKLRVKEMIIERLKLEGMTPAQIEDQAPLFGDGLGLDSIDALELALEISKRFGVQLRSDDEDNRKIFASLRALTTYVHAHRPT